MKKFAESLDTAVFTTKFVLFEEALITTVYHFEDGSWQFSGSEEFEDAEDVIKVTSLGEIIEMDSSVLELADMPEGHYAFRESKEEDWAIEEFEES